jgi:hypothetical protein
LAKLLGQQGRTARELAAERKSAEWKVALAATMKARTTATNRWLGANLHMGGLHEVSRQASTWQRRRELRTDKAASMNTNDKA